MEEEVKALERKLFLEEIALYVTDERCYFLDRNFRQAIDFLSIFESFSEISNHAMYHQYYSIFNITNRFSKRDSSITDH